MARLVSLVMPMSDHLATLDAATRRLMATLADLDDEAARHESLLPGWSRGHVLTHLARNADAMRNFVLSARARTFVGMYGSRELRNADIDNGADRPAELLVLDVATAAARLAIEYATVPEELWAAGVNFGSGTEPTGPTLSLERTVTARTREVELHHVDLAMGYAFASTPADLLASLLDDTVGRQRSNGLAANLVAADSGRTWRLGNGGPTVTGDAADLLAWLCGRPHGLSGELPTVASLG
jgi:maleylpyruvate isomerase